MLFDKDLDESLWCILEGDSEKRNEIIEFLNKMPGELIENIRNILQFQIDYSKEEIPDYEGSVVADDGTTYSFIVEFDDEEKSLEIKQSFATPENQSHINLGVELTLVKEMPNYKPEKGEKLWIGNFTKTFFVAGIEPELLDFGEGRFMPHIEFSEGKSVASGYSKEIEYEYDIIDDMKTLVRFSCLKGDHHSFPIDMSGIPEVLTLDYISKRYGEVPKNKKLVLPNNE